VRFAQALVQRAGWIGQDSPVEAGGTVCLGLCLEHPLDRSCGQVARFDLAVAVAS